MRKRPMSVVLLLIALSVAAHAVAQEADEHAAHHPAPAVAPAKGAIGSSSIPAVAMPTATSASAPAMAGMAGMAGMMESMDKMAACCGPGQYNGPFISRLLALPTLDAAARLDLAREGGDRTQRGLDMVSQGASAGMSASNLEEREAAARMLREGSDLFTSGAIATRAFEKEASGPTVATNWFRTQLALGALPLEPHASHPFGVSPAHLLLMLFLTLVSASLIGLQIFRMQRIRRIVEAAPNPSQGHSPVPIFTGQKKETVPEAPPATSAAEAHNDLGTIESSNAQSPTATALPRAKTWKGTLRVVQTIQETPTIKTYRLADSSADRLPFDFLPGQFLQVEVETEPGKPARRSYTIASSPTQRAYVELSVKREEHGAVSRFLHDVVKNGDLIKVSGPFGAFTFTGTDADSVVLIAGGVGITPMMSVLRYLTDTAWPGEIFFLYGARSTEEFAFREDIERLERRHENLHVFAAMQRSPGTVWHGPEGPITKEMLASAVPDLAHRRIHLCGPPAMMASMKAQLAELGVSEAQLHTEAFGPASLPIDPPEPLVRVGPVENKPRAAQSIPPEAGDGIAAATITFSISGVSAPLPAEQTVLEAAEGAGVEIPYACRTGECGVCVTKLLDGEVTMEVETGLAAEDKANGYILACQAKSSGKALMVEA